MKSASFLIKKMKNKYKGKICLSMTVNLKINTLFCTVKFVQWIWRLLLYSALASLYTEFENYYFILH